MAKSLLLHATSGQEEDYAPTLPQLADCSGDESTFGEHSTDGNTSGALNSDEDPYQNGSISGTDYLSETDPVTFAVRVVPGNAQSTSRA